jgi:vancomycin resistance protein VanW
MRRPTSEPAEGGPPSASLRGAALFTLKAFLLRRQRTLRDLRLGRPRRYSRSDGPSEIPLVASVHTRLRAGKDEGTADRALTAGKIHNLRLAAARVDGVEVAAGAVFSLWAHLGPPTRRRGFIEGRELREGCMIPTIGGGLCQLSNALYCAALEAGFEIVERHAHSFIVPGSEAAAGRDATIFWNYVDLRFRSDHPFRVEAMLTDEDLIVSLLGTATRASAFDDRNEARREASECTLCGVTDCRRHVA